VNLNDEDNGRILTARGRTWRDVAAAAAQSCRDAHPGMMHGIDGISSGPATLSYDRTRLASCAQAIAAAGRKLGAQGLTPATSSNFSMRLDAGHAAVTVSGRDKGALTPDDVMVVDMDGHAVDTAARPSAETLLHTQIYRRFAEANAVLHTHSRTQTVASRLFAPAGKVRLEGYELLKAIAGHNTHETFIDLPVFPNSQRMEELVARVDDWIRAEKPLYGYLIEGHGIYAWGRDMAEAERHIEAFEHLLACELDLRRLRTSKPERQKSKVKGQ
jgi:methylthioribulose-1-phosphate dehydratase